MSKSEVPEEALEEVDSAFSLNNTAQEKSKVTKPTLKGNLFILLFLVVYILFNLLAAYLFTLIERKEIEGQEHWLPAIKREFLGNHNACITTEELEAFLEKLELAVADGVDDFKGGEAKYYPKRWTLENAFILAFTVATTIGYGVITPVSNGGQIFCIIYALLSIPFTGILAAKMGVISAYYIKSAATRVLGLVPKAKMAGLFFTSLLGLLIYVFLPSILLYAVGNDEQWTYVGCLYCVVVTLTTTGFGDYVPDPSSTVGFIGLILVLVWVIAGLSWFATIIQLIATHMSKHAKSIRRKVNVSSPKVIKRITARRFSSNGNGKNRTKYPPHDETGTMENCELQNGNVDTKVNGQDANNSMLNGHANQDFLPQTTEDNLVENEACLVSGPGSFHTVVISVMGEEKATQT
ncbi:unnamed protein product [Clavelina lepadiformis]|uniref:Potassium channel domain-containing protein n=1 Tax=Clavelina lepadiformis TaxID=159417 RepID=A0ABP0H3A7_CLALP